METSPTERVRKYSRLIRSLQASGTEFVLVAGNPGDDGPAAYWVGAALSVKGGEKGFPTVEEAIADGLFYPGCTRHLVPFEPRRVSAARRGVVEAATRYAVRAKKARERGEPMPARDPLLGANSHARPVKEDAPAETGLSQEELAKRAQNARVKFERVYEAARKAISEGDTALALQKCKAAADILREGPAFSGQQDSLLTELEDRIQQLEEERSGS